ncbi:MAG: hypothetical protein QF828_09325 [Pseudomonadales bacterium]|nr:hypothetical protein [Pseudomonadales bacterium]
MDDWELRGDGFGDPREIQFKAMRIIRDIYARNGIKGSFNVEVYQQLAYLKLADEYPELKRCAQEWEDVVLETYQQGHDIQFHWHAQWSQASYDNEEWTLNGSWSLPTYQPDEIVSMLSTGKAYLEALIQRVDPDYRCVSFRSGSWAVAPSPSLLKILADLGFLFDMSNVGGLMKAANSPAPLDYSSIDEDFLPYYPRMDDARRVAETPSDIIELPTCSFTPSLLLNFFDIKDKVQYRVLKRLQEKIRKKQPNTTAAHRKVNYNVWDRYSTNSMKLSVMRSLVKPRRIIADLSALNFSLMKHMLDTIRERSTAYNADVLPIILENHTKNVKDWSDIERFAKYLAKQDDIDVITLAETAKLIQNGKINIRTAYSEKTDTLFAPNTQEEPHIS